MPEHHHKATGLILAARRKGAVDPVAALQNKSHKCLVEIDGEVMLVRVIRSLLDSGQFERIHICIESPEPLRTVPQLAAWLDQDVIRTVTSRGNLADSVLSAVDQIEAAGDSAFPLLVTTGDNALQTPELVGDFLNRFWPLSAEIGVAFTRDDVVLAEHPEAGLAFHRLKDGGFSADNIYLLKSPAALKAVKVFESGGQFGKRHIRLLTSFGLLPFILYKLKAITGAGLIRLIGRNLGVPIEMVLTPYAYGPIDVDNPSSFALCEKILRERRLAAGV